jgi:hypothetical protein
LAAARSSALLVHPVPSAGWQFVRQVYSKECI